MRIAAFRRAHFNAAHRLHNPAWSDEKNQEVFGLCNNPNYHGHNYELLVSLAQRLNGALWETMDDLFELETTEGGGGNGGRRRGENLERI